MATVVTAETSSSAWEGQSGASRGLEREALSAGGGLRSSGGEADEDGSDEGADLDHFD